MTIAVAVKVHDGIVLSSDSASTLHFLQTNGDGAPIPNVYNHANKTFNLYKGLPVGMMTWGGGSIGSASISTLAKDFRQLITDKDDEYDDWRVDPQDYSIEEVTNKARRFFFEDNYQPFFEDVDQEPDIGFMFAGYSSGADLPEIWQFQIQNGQCEDPVPRRSREETGLSWSGEIEAITRLVKGHGVGLPNALQQLGVPGDQLEPAMENIGNVLEAPLAPPPMPIQDAINLAEFLVSTTVQFSKFTPGPPTVGGPIEIAAITKHEGFKWVDRKHYFGAKLNPSMLSPGTTRRSIGNREYENQQGEEADESQV